MRYILTATTDNVSELKRLNAFVIFKQKNRIFNLRVKMLIVKRSESQD